jgi:regulator of protease activity HflC (stomatin/prohibitin superfamily)
MERIFVAMIQMTLKVNPYGILVDQVTIANVSLPANLADSMQKETAFETK